MSLLLTIFAAVLGAVVGAAEALGLAGTQETLSEPSTEVQT